MGMFGRVGQLFCSACIEASSLASEVWVYKIKTRLSLGLLALMAVGWLMPGLYQEVSVVDTKLTPFALSRSRQSTVSSRDHEKFLSL